MSHVLLSAPTVGTVVKKIIAFNPALTAQDLITIVKQSVRVQEGSTDGFPKAELIDEKRALELARATLDPKAPAAEQSW